jgi:hypothetical protein
MGDVEGERWLASGGSGGTISLAPVRFASQVMPPILAIAIYTSREQLAILV